MYFCTFFQQFFVSFTQYKKFTHIFITWSQIYNRANIRENITSKNAFYLSIPVFRVHLLWKFILYSNNFAFTQQIYTAVSISYCIKIIHISFLWLQLNFFWSVPWYFLIMFALIKNILHYRDRQLYSSWTIDNKGYLLFFNSFVLFYGSFHLYMKSGSHCMYIKDPKGKLMSNYLFSIYH